MIKMNKKLSEIVASMLYVQKKGFVYNCVTAGSDFLPALFTNIVQDFLYYKIVLTSNRPDQVRAGY